MGSDYKAKEKEAKTEALPKKEFSMVEKNNLRNPGELFKKQLDRQLKFKEDDEKSNNGSLVNQFLGEYRTTAKAVNIISLASINVAIKFLLLIHTLLIKYVSIHI